MYPIPPFVLPAYGYFDYALILSSGLVDYIFLMYTCVKMNVISFPPLWLSPLKLFLAQETEINPPNHLYTSVFVAFGRLNNIVCYHISLVIFYRDGTKVEVSATFMLDKVSGDCWNYSTCSETWLAQQLDSEERPPFSMRSVRKVFDFGNKCNRFSTSF